MSADVTVVVIAFNEARRIEPCVSALLSQVTDLAVDVVVVDDGSTDGTPDVVERLRAGHPNLTLLRQPVNGGRGAARRRGQDYSTSRWIGFVDADIVVPPDWVERCHAALATLDGVSGVAQPDGDCAVLWRIARPTLRTRPGSAEITGNNVLFAREALARVPFSPEARLGEDFRLAKTMLAHGIRLGTLRDLTVRHLETKSYGQGVAWMWQSGVDATSLLVEFRVLRMPDVAWASWLAVVVAALAAGSAGAIPWALAGALAAGMTVLVALAFSTSRFRLRPHPARFAYAVTLSVPLMLAYLAGRTAGVVRALARPRRGA